MGFKHSIDVLSVDYKADSDVRGVFRLVAAQIMESNLLSVMRVVATLIYAFIHFPGFFTMDLLNPMSLHTMAGFNVPNCQTSGSTTKFNSHLLL